MRSEKSSIVAAVRLAHDTFDDDVTAPNDLFSRALFSSIHRDARRRRVKCVRGPERCAETYERSLSLWDVSRRRLTNIQRIPYRS